MFALTNVNKIDFSKQKREREKVGFERKTRYLSLKLTLILVGSYINGANSKALKVLNQKEVYVVTRKKKIQRPLKEEKIEG